MQHIAQAISALRVTVPDVIIAIMGQTGTGKSTFSNLVSGSNFVTSDSMKSCTATVQATMPFRLDGKLAALIDTPGFDDTLKGESEILGMIEKYVRASYTSGRKLNGIIYMHSIAEGRMAGKALQNFQLLKNICGEDNLSSVVIVTTMWPTDEDDLLEAEEREEDLKTFFFKDALENHATMMRHDGTARSAQDIVRVFLSKSPVTLLVQNELVDERKALTETTVGEGIRRILEQEREEHASQRKLLDDSLQAKYEKASADNSQLQEKLQEMEERINSEQARRAEEMARMKQQHQDALMERERAANAERERLRQEITENMVQHERIRRADDERVQSMTERQAAERAALEARLRAEFQRQLDTERIAAMEQAHQAKQEQMRFEAELQKRLDAERKLAEERVLAAEQERARQAEEQRRIRAELQEKLEAERRAAEERERAAAIERTRQFQEEQARLKAELMANLAVERRAAAEREREITARQLQQEATRKAEEERLRQAEELRVRTRAAELTARLRKAEEERREEARKSKQKKGWFESCVIC